MYQAAEQQKLNYEDTLVALLLVCDNGTQIPALPSMGLVKGCAHPQPSVVSVAIPSILL